LDGYFIEVNPAFSRILEHTEKELLATPFMEFIHPEDIESTKQVVESLQNGEPIFSYENRYIHKNGTYRVISWSFTQAEDQLIYCVGREMTETKRVENKLSHILSSLNEHFIIAITDAAGIITEVNKKFCDISGYSEAELIGQNHRIINSGNHPKAYFEKMWKTITSGKTWSGIIENKTKNGQHYFVQTIITPIFDSQNKIENYISIRTDVTEHFESMIKFNKMLDTLNETNAIAKVGGWELIIATGELNWTDQTFKILEVEKKEGQKPILPEGLNLFTEKFKPIMEKAVQRAIEFGEPYSLEVEALTAKGNILWVYTNGKANYKDGVIVSLSGTIQDIHQRKLIEMNYEKERLKSLQNSKLASLGEMSAGIAHEINNPLSVISGYIALIEKMEYNPEKLQYKIDIIKKSTERIAKIVKSLKKYSRVSNINEFKLEPLGQIIYEAVNLVKINPKSLNVDISIELDSEHNLFCNEIQIEQVIINLLNNAIDAIQNLDRKWIKIHAKEFDSVIELRIIDSGNGIPSQVVNHLFDAFYTTKEIGKGTGLGLSIVKGILEDHNATIFVDPECSNTCFVIRFEKSNC